LFTVADPLIRFNSVMQSASQKAQRNRKMRLRKADDVAVIIQPAGDMITTRIRAALPGSMVNFRKVTSWTQS